MNSESVKALVRNLSKKSGIESRMLLTSYMIGCFLERVSVSPHKDHFILKGGMLIAAMVGVDLRSTVDLDATIKYMHVSQESIEEAIREIIAVPVDDGVTFRVLRVRNIRDEFEYECFRFHFEAIIEKTVVPFHIDISTGDVITPKEIHYRFKLLLEDREIDILAYNLETVLAEKLEAVLYLGTASTRMRDLYDLYVLHALQRQNIDMTTLNSALWRTASMRHHEQEVRSWSQILINVENDSTIRKLWDEYRSYHPYAKDIDFGSTIEAVRSLLQGLSIDS